MDIVGGFALTEHWLLRNDIHSSQMRSYTICQQLLRITAYLLFGGNRVRNGELRVQNLLDLKPCGFMTLGARRWYVMHGNSDCVYLRAIHFRIVFRHAMNTSPNGIKESSVMLATRSRISGINYRRWKPPLNSTWTLLDRSGRILILGLIWKRLCGNKDLETTI